MSRVRTVLWAAWSWVSQWKATQNVVRRMWTLNALIFFIFRANRLLALSRYALHPQPRHRTTILWRIGINEFMNLVLYSQSVHFEYTFSLSANTDGHDRNHIALIVEYESSNTARAQTPQRSIKIVRIRQMFGLLHILVVRYFLIKIFSFGARSSNGTPEFVSAR